MTTERKGTGPVKKTRRTIGAVCVVSLLALTGCGGKDSDGGTSETATDSASAPGGGPGFDSDQLEAIKTCLKAAGLEDKIPDLPTGQPTDRPTDAPSDFTGAPPSGAPDGGGFAAFQDEEVQAALTACGIDLPERPTGAPTG